MPRADPSGADRPITRLRRGRLRSGPDLDGVVVWFDLGADIVAFERSDGLRCVANIGDESVTLPSHEVLLASGPIVGHKLPPDAAVWVG